MCIIQFIDGSQGPVRHTTTEGAFAVTSFESKDAAQTFLNYESQDDRLHVVALDRPQYIAWLRDAVHSYGVTHIFPNPDHVRDVGNYRSTSAVALLLLLESNP